MGCVASNANKFETGLNCDNWQGLETQHGSIQTRKSWNKMAKFLKKITISTDSQRVQLLMLVKIFFKTKVCN